MGAPRKARTIDRAEVSIPELAQLFRVSESAVMKMAREEGMPKLGRGRYPLMDCVHWRLDQLAASDSSAIEESRRLLYDKQREKHDLDIAERRRELVPAEEVGTALREMFGLCRTGVESIGPRVAYRVAQERDPVKITEVIVSECRHILASMAKSVEAFAGDMDGGEDAEAAAPPQRRAVGRRAPVAAPGESGAGALAD